MYHIIVNSNRLQGKYQNELERVKTVFEHAGKEYAVHITQRSGHAKEIAAALTEGDSRQTLIAMGGDGTLHEVLNGIRDVEKCNLGLIPLGTGNDFATTAKIPMDAKTAAEIIAFKAPSDIDYIQLSNGMRSINAVGAGIDVDVLKRTYAGKHTGKNKYYKAFVKSLANYKSFNFTVIYDGKEEKHNGLLACLGNGKQIGGGIKLFPAAKLDDGYMDLVIVDYLSKFKTLVAFIKLAFGKIDSIKEVTCVKCKSATFIPDGEQQTIQAEGELYDGITLDAKLISGKLKFYLPEND
jgi:YegS/Rv2252/BmrU family lipid kinase